MAFLSLPENKRIVEDPPIAKILFNDVRLSILWLVVRVWLGYQWINSASGKLSEPGWMETGESLQAYWVRAVAIPETGRPAITFDWYRSFLQGMLDSGAYEWFAKVIAVGEFLVGVGLIVGAFVGIAAFFGAVMNFNFMLAGSASTNPVLFFAAILLILAWKTAGYIGLDYFLLNILGTPWGRRKFENEQEPEVVYEPSTSPAGD